MIKKEGKKAEEKEEEKKPRSGTESESIDSRESINPSNDVNDRQLPGLADRALVWGSPECGRKGRAVSPLVYFMSARVIVKMDRVD
ncbi:hypothetical protein RRG08_018090 [Elysia crispata]|uniref:Uncharacterized protein n=1 Tax=Elysia crispata TaxID=231223 RepID=A0AAE1DER7_9GAST|nr:hypothetical protein RRG08_018090 [Elysia crispata]